MVQCKCLLLALAGLMLVGCNEIRPHVPDGWVMRDEQPVATVEAAYAAPQQGRLQLVICYGKLLSAHAALRLMPVHNPPLYWDPGGKFGLYSTGYTRRKDIVTEPAPDMDELWAYRKRRGHNYSMLIFEWDLPRDRIEHIRRTLLAGLSDEQGPNIFETDAEGMQCSTYVSRFLTLHTQDVIPIEKTYMYPHDLGRKLWKHEPSRVYLFDIGQDVITYVPAPEPPRGEIVQRIQAFDMPVK